ncbi:MAG: hypothetical protein ACKV2V_27260, partial [Blastocatellia bacterium]
MYRAYMTEMGAIERQLLNEAVRQRQGINSETRGREEPPLTITEARALLPADQQRQIREQARDRAWDRLLVPEDVTARIPQAGRLNEAIVRLRQDTQQRAVLAQQAFRQVAPENNVAPRLSLAADSGRRNTDAAPDRLSILEANALRAR